MTETEIAYLAGLIDGDGTICCFRDKKRKIIETIKVEIVTNNLDFAKNLFEKYSVYFDHLKINHKTNACHIFSYRMEKNIKFISDILPYLILKHMKAILVLNYLKQIIKFREERIGQKMSKEELEFRKTFYNLINSFDETRNVINKENFDE
jgi:hypothetical protein